MSRNSFWFLCALLFALSAPVEAQKPKKVPLVGYLAAVSATADAPRLEAFRQGLRDLGYVEGQNIVVDYRHVDGDFERLLNLKTAERIGVTVPKSVLSLADKVIK